MSFVNIQLPPGIVRNATPYDTPGRWWDMNLVRWQSGTVRPIGGWQQTNNKPLDSNARLIHMFRDNANVRRMITGTENKLYVFDSGFIDITPNNMTPLSSIGVYGGYGIGRYGVEAYGTVRSVKTSGETLTPFWSVANWGQDLILTSNADGFLYYYVSNTPSTPPVKIANAPAGNMSVVVTNERHVMLIGASGSSAGGSIRRVSWSSRETYGNNVDDWNFASTTNTAGYLDVDARTPLIKGVNVREGVLILSASEAYLARYVGQPYVYSIDRIADTTILSPMAIATYNGKAAWMGKNCFWRYEGGYLTQLECPILNDVFVNIDPTYGPRRSFAVHNGTFPEIWFFYPEIGHEECNKVVIWNYTEDCWYWSDLSRTAGVSGETYIHPFMGGSDGFVYEHEFGWTDSGAARNVFLESGMLPISNGDRGSVVNRVLPANGHGYNSMAIEFYARQAPEGSETTFGPYYARNDGYMDCRVNGRDLRVRITSRENDEWSVGAFRVNVEPGTGR